MARPEDEGRSKVRHGRLKSQKSHEAAGAASDRF